MTATTRQHVGRAGPHWVLLLRPRWLAWHAFVVLATAGMLYLGDWQLHRAESGNELSWAYTFEWPLFAGFAVYFWFKSLRDELREGGAEAGAAESEPGAAESEPGAAESAAAASGSGAAVTAAAAGGIAAATAVGTLGAVVSASAAATARRAASWDATSWDAISWAATGGQVAGRETVAGGTGGTGSAGGSGGPGQPVDVARATPADGEAYVARLRAEVERSGRRRRRR
jgi:hypothetical protein